MNSYWVPHAGSENHCKTTKSLKICYLFNTNQEKVYHTKISDIDKLKQRINSEWAALSHAVIEYHHRHVVSICALALVLEADILNFEHKL